MLNNNNNQSKFAIEYEIHTCNTVTAFINEDYTDIIKRFILRVLV
jgi:hypothetical protein